MVEHVDASDIDSLKYILDFLAMSLKRPPSSLPQDQVNSEKWVRNQAMQNFGPIIHSIYEKVSKKGPKLSSQQVFSKIVEVCNGFYDLKLLKVEQTPEQFSPTEEIEKLKEMWAYHMPCVLLINKAEYW